MNCLKKEIFLWGLIISTLIFSYSLNRTINNTLILSHDHCNNLPNISFYSYSEILNIITNLILKSKKMIYFTIENINIESFTNDILPFLKIQSLKGIQISPIFNLNPTLSNLLNNNGIKNFTIFNKISQILSFDSILIDEEIFILPKFFSYNGSNIIIQTINIKNCQPAFNDFLGFLKLYILEQSSNSSNIYSLNQSLISQSSAIRPTIINNEESFYFFHSPDNISRPLRISSDRITESIFLNIPKKIYLYSENFPKLISKKKDDLYPSSLYIQLKTLMNLNKTEFNFLLSKQYCENSLNLCGNLLSFSKNNLKLIPNNYLGPNFMIIDNSILIYSSSKFILDSKTYLLLHLLINSNNISNIFKNYFNQIWNISYSLDIKWFL